MTSKNNLHELIEELIELLRKKENEIGQVIEIQTKNLAEEFSNFEAKTKAKLDQFLSYQDSINHIISRNDVVFMNSKSLLVHSYQ